MSRFLWRAAPGPKPNRYGGDVTRPGTVPRRAGTGAPMLSSGSPAPSRRARSTHVPTCGPLPSPARGSSVPPHRTAHPRPRREAACRLPCRYDTTAPASSPVRPHGGAADCAVPAEEQRHRRGGGLHRLASSTPGGRTDKAAARKRRLKVTPRGPLGQSYEATQYFILQANHK